MNELEQYSLKHVLHEAKHCADVLANFGSNQEEDIGFLVYSVVPCEIVLYLNQDATA